MERLSDVSPNLALASSSSNIPSNIIKNSAAIISALSDATLLAESTLNYLSSSFFSFNLNSTNSSGHDSAVCPFDRRHHLPPESLFYHSLSCSSSPGIPLRESHHLQQLIKRLNYPHSLKSTQQFAYLTDPDTCDVCFSLDDSNAVVNNNDDSFFYKDCPAVVSFSNNEAVSEADNIKTFLLPSILLSECANGLNSVDDSFSFPAVCILPSEFWALKCELEAWNNVDYPTSYSCVVLRLLGSSELDETCRKLNKWILCSSSQYGILIDVAVRDHLFVLFKLCLKAIRKEASLIISDDKIAFSNLKTARFSCTKLAESLTWLAAQLSILYGEQNGKLFAREILKQSLLCLGSESMLFKFGQSKCEEIYGTVHLDSKFDEAKEKIRKTEKRSGQIFVSQIATSISALHERRWLEDKIIGLRFPHMIPKSQLVAEYSYASARAQEIRETRPNYKAVPEHDGIIWQRGNNLDSAGRPKSREELLAEERDYKRRRMSYRGKKVSRNPTEVLHDIIEEHMNELKHAGGTECDVKSTEWFENFPADRKTNNKTTSSATRNDKYADTETKQQLYRYGKPIHSYSSDRSRKSRDIQNSPKDLKMEYSDNQHSSRRTHKEKSRGSEACVYKQRSSSRDDFFLSNKGKTDCYRSKSKTEIVFDDRYDPSVS